MSSNSSSFSTKKGNEGAVVPEEDRSPRELPWLRASLTEVALKAPLRRLLYPIWGWITTRYLAGRYGGLAPFEVDRWLWGQRGNDYAAHRRRVDRLLRLRGKRIFIAGCGTGRDMGSWLSFRPARVVGLDYLNYRSAWERAADHFRRHFPQSSVEFHQGNARDLEMFADGEFDLIGSDAVFEHIADVPAVALELTRILRPGGLFYATFGPLWYCWHGDHYSGWDALSSGYNHLVLDTPCYERYLAQAPAESLEESSRMWHEHGLFSRLRPHDYVSILEQLGFARRFVGIIVEPKAVRCLNENKALREQLLNRYHEFDLVIGGMTVIYQKLGS